jgi:hypothetical protein
MPPPCCGAGQEQKVTNAPRSGILNISPAQDYLAGAAVMKMQSGKDAE